MNLLSDSLASLSAREKNLLAAGAVVALVIVLYSLAWRPWQEELSRLRAQVPEKEQTLAWMKAQSAQIGSLVGSSKTAAAASGLPLLTTIERSANQVAIRKSITRMSPGDKDNQVRIWMDNADFDVWLRWLQSLKTRGIEVVEVNIDRSAEGKANIRATLQR